MSSVLHSNVNVVFCCCVNVYGNLASILWVDETQRGAFALCELVMVREEGFESCLVTRTVTLLFNSSPLAGFWMSTGLVWLPLTPFTPSVGPMIRHF